jgi:hypothetical protein
LTHDRPSETADNMRIAANIWWDKWFKRIHPRFPALR